jgi:hypothetical protein
LLALIEAVIAGSVRRPGLVGERPEDPAAIIGLPGARIFVPEVADKIAQADQGGDRRRTIAREAEVLFPPGRLVGGARIDVVSREHTRGEVEEGGLAGARFTDEQQAMVAVEKDRQGDPALFWRRSIGLLLSGRRVFSAIAIEVEATEGGCRGSRSACASPLVRWSRSP